MTDDGLHQTISTPFSLLCYTRALSSCDINRRTMSRIHSSQVFRLLELYYILVEQL